MNRENIVQLFNEYIIRLKDNIANCKMLSLSIKISDTEFAYALSNNQELSASNICVKSLYSCDEDSDSERHRHIYINTKGSEAIIHATAPNTSAVAKSGSAVPVLLDDLAQIIGGEVKCSKLFNKSIIKNLKRRKGTLVEDGSIITYGRSLDEAYAGCLVLEKGAKCYIDATILGSYRKISRLETKLMHFIYQKKYSKANQQEQKSKQQGKDNSQTKNYDCSAEELNIRQGIIDAGQKLLQNNLVQGTWGNISVRLDDNHMLITPSGRDYMSLVPKDIVLVNLDTMKHYGTLKPSGEKGIHAALLKERKDIAVVMHSHPSECSSFAAASFELPVINEKMQRYVKGSARVANYALPSTKSLAKATVKAMQGRNACFMANHGMLAVGKDIMDTFECCRVLEESAKSYIDSLTAQVSQKEHKTRISLYLAKTAQKKNN